MHIPPNSTDEDRRTDFKAYWRAILAAWTFNLTSSLVIAFLFVASAVAAAYSCPQHIFAAIGVVSLIWASLALPLAGFQAWRRDRLKWINSEKQRLFEIPNVEVGIGEIGSALDEQMRPLSNETETVVVIYLAVHNQGGNVQPLRWQVSATKVNGAIVEGSKYEPFRVARMRTAVDGKVAVFGKEQSLTGPTYFDKVIERGRTIRGYLLITFSCSESEIDPLSFQVTMKDTTGRLWSSKRGIVKDE